MAQVSRQPIAPLHDRLTVTLQKEDYLPAFDASLKKYAKSAAVPGFRKGHVPAGMIKKMYGPSLFTDEVLRQAGTALEDYLRKERVAIFAQPMPAAGDQQPRIDMNAPADLDFHFEIGVKPDFEIPALQNGAALTRYTVRVSDTMLDDELQRLTRRYGQVENPESVTAADDIIYASYQTEGGEAIDDTEMMDRLPQFLQDKLQGAKAGDVITFRTSELGEGSEDFLKKTLKLEDAAESKEYTLTLTKIGHLIPAELTPELFMQVFPQDLIATETQFRERLRMELSKEFDRMAGERLNSEIYEMLVHNTPINLPVDFLKRWLREGQEGGPKSAAEVDKEFPGFDHQLRWTLISDKLIQDNEIQVSHQDVTDDIKGKVLQHFGMEDADEAPWMEGYMQKVVKDDKMMNDTYRKLLFDRLFQWLHTKFATVEQEVSEEDFFKLPAPGAGHHHH